MLTYGVIKKIFSEFEIQNIVNTKCNNVARGGGGFTAVTQRCVFRRACGENRRSTQGRTWANTSALLLLYHAGYVLGIYSHVVSKNSLAESPAPRIGQMWLLMWCFSCGRWRRWRGCVKQRSPALFSLKRLKGTAFFRMTALFWPCFPVDCCGSMKWVKAAPCYQDDWSLCSMRTRRRAQLRYDGWGE